MVERIGDFFLRIGVMSAEQVAEFCGSRRQAINERSATSLCRKDMLTFTHSRPMLI
jgi:hypothetical protein